MIGLGRRKLTLRRSWGGWSMPRRRSSTWRRRSWTWSRRRNGWVSSWRKRSWPVKLRSNISSWSERGKRPLTLCIAAGRQEEGERLSGVRVQRPVHQVQKDWGWDEVVQLGGDEIQQPHQASRGESFQVELRARHYYVAIVISLRLFTAGMLNLSMRENQQRRTSRAAAAAARTRSTNNIRNLSVTSTESAQESQV